MGVALGDSWISPIGKFTVTERKGKKGERERERERGRESFSATQHPISATTYVDMFICIAKLGLHIIYASVRAIPTYRVYPRSMMMQFHYYNNDIIILLYNIHVIII